MKEWITGRNPVYECLRANRRHFYRLLVNKGSDIKDRLGEIISLARKAHIEVQMVDKNRLADITENHQGIALQVDDYHRLLYPVLCLVAFSALRERASSTLEARYSSELQASESRLRQLFFATPEKSPLLAGLPPENLQRSSPRLMDLTISSKDASPGSTT